MLKRLRALIILAGFCAACGGTPDDIEAKASSLTAGQVYTGTGLFIGGNYNCGGDTFYARQAVQQSWNGAVVQSGHTTLMYSGGLDPARNEISVICPGTDDWVNSSTMTSVVTQTCQFLSHRVGQRTWGRGPNVTIPAGWLTYYPIGSFGLPNGAWIVGLEAASGNGSLVGLSCPGQTVPLAISFAVY